jgi:hypothetical protein
MTTTKKNLSVTDVFSVGEKVVWVAPTGYKELVTITGFVVGQEIVVVRTWAGQQMKFWEREGQFVGVEHWGYIAKPLVIPQLPVKPSFWTRLKNYFL